MLDSKGLINFDNPADGILSVGRSDNGVRLAYSAETGPLVVYFLVGGIIRLLIQPSMERLIESVREGTLDFTLTKPDGTKAVGKVTSGSNGTATWQYKIGTKDPIGTYSIVSSATYQSQTATSNLVTFAVR